MNVQLNIKKIRDNRKKKGEKESKSGNFLVKK